MGSPASYGYVSNDRASCEYVFTPTNKSETVQYASLHCGIRALRNLNKEPLAVHAQDRYERNPDGSFVPLTVRRKPSDQLVLKMLASHFPHTCGDKVDVNHRHSGIIAVARLCRDGKIWPVGPPQKVEREIDDGLVASADSGDPIDPRKTKISRSLGSRSVGRNMTTSTLVRNR